MAFPLPDVLVMGVGGVLGEAWTSGVLAGIEDAAGIDFRRVDTVVGTSAGSIVGAGLVAGRAPRRPPEAGGNGARAAHPGGPAGGLAAAAREAAGRVTSYAAVAAAPIGALALSAAAPGGALMRAAVLNRLPRPNGSNRRLERDVDKLNAAWDGRFRVCAVDRRRGRRVVFGAPGAPRVTVAEAVAASCAVPWLFAPVRIGDREYVDGGVWSPTNLDVAPAGAGTEVLCLTPTGGAALPRPVWRALKAAGRTAAELEASALRRRGARVRIVGPDRTAAEAMGGDFMATGPSGEVLRAGYRQGRAMGFE
jgi:NTE family protein